MDNKVIRQCALSVLLLLGIIFSAPVSAQPTTDTNYYILWTSAGYSRITNNVAATHAVGNLGGGVGAGYELHYKRFLLQTGIELSHYTSKMGLRDTLLAVPMVDTEGDPFEGRFTFENTSDMQKITNIGIPLMLGIESPFGFYMAIGGKCMLNVAGSSRTVTDVTSRAYYEYLIGDADNGVISNMPNHGLSSERRTTNSALRLHTIFTGSVEIGYTFGKSSDNIMLRNKPKVRLSLFCDYGFAPVKSSDRRNDIFVNVSKTEEYMPGIRGYLLNDLTSSRLNILYAGLKMTILLGRSQYKCNCTPE